MNINKDGKTLYFSDEEIENDTNGEKKVFVAKRINGKETHGKAKKSKHMKEDFDETKKFNFNDEIVIGVTDVQDEKEQKSNKKNKKKKRYRKNEKINNEKSKRRKKKKINKKLVTFFSSIILIIAVAIFVLITPIFNITNIKFG